MEDGFFFFKYTSVRCSFPPEPYELFSKLEIKRAKELHCTNIFDQAAPWGVGGSGKSSLYPKNTNAYGGLASLAETQLELACCPWNCFQLLVPQPGSSN